MSAENHERRSVAEQAAAWLEDLDSADRGQRAAFLRWLEASPLHVHEALLAGRVRSALASVDPERRIDVDALLEQARVGSNVRSLKGLRVEPASITKARRTWALGIAAVVATVVVASGFFFHFLHAEPLYETQRGEQRMVRLDDGSVVFLNTQTQIEVRYRDTSRDIYLGEGQALFDVSHDAARPFRVHAASAVIQAIGTQFDVRLDRGQARVAVVEGVVQVSSRDDLERPTGQGTDVSPMPAKIEAGNGAVVENSGEVKPARAVDTKAVTAWRQQRLIFHDTALSEIASEFNRYNNSLRLRVEGDELRARRFDGSFNALRPESFLTYLAREQGLVFERRKNEVVIRVQAHAP